MSAVLRRSDHRDTYDAVMALVREHSGAYGMGVDYAYTMVHKAPERVQQLLAAGQPVFVDFTAAWCVTCQYNKKTTLANADVLADLSAKKVALLRADWTRRDPAITAALADRWRCSLRIVRAHPILPAS